MKTLDVDGVKVRIQIWDTAGQERYQTITKQYYRRAQGIFLVYDITSAFSFQHIVKWVSDVDEKILLGNKSDKEHRRQVATEQGSKVPIVFCCHGNIFFWGRWLHHTFLIQQKFGAQDQNNTYSTPTISTRVTIGRALLGHLSGVAELKTCAFLQACWPPK
ncbi:ras-related protein Rab-15-like isoform X1 [Salminus brasiliensis]|uniref:ras-related protein Rab-15-like isoform X1 n=1 Tax=Salminus brasiliensis TaxID=930266 RepID=UPI003B82FCFA